MKPSNTFKILLIGIALFSIYPLSFTFYNIFFNIFEFASYSNRSLNAFFLVLLNYASEWLIIIGVLSLSVAIKSIVEIDKTNRKKSAVSYLSMGLILIWLYPLITSYELLFHFHFIYLSIWIFVLYAPFIGITFILNSLNIFRKDIKETRC